MDAWVYVVLLGIAVMVYAILLPNRNAGKEQLTVGEIEEALDRFVDVMEEDNRELLDTVNGWRRQLEADLNRLNGRLDALARRVDERDRQGGGNAAQPVHAASGEATAPAVEATPAGAGSEPAPAVPQSNMTEPEPAAPQGIRGRYPELFAWHDAGKSVEYIAKKSGMNKGEVMLILQLAKREAERGV